MNLVISKNQSKGMMGAVSFEVRAQAQLSEEERKLVQHYKLENEVLFSRKMVNLWGQSTDADVRVTVRQLLNGDTYKCKDLGEVIGYTDSLKDACQTLKAYLEVAREFGGQEVYEID